MFDFCDKYLNETRIKSSRVTSRSRRLCSKNMASVMPDKNGPRPRDPGKTGQSTDWNSPSLASVISRSEKLSAFEIQSADLLKASKVDSKLGSRDE